MERLTDEEILEEIKSEKLQIRFWKLFDRNVVKGNCWLWKGESRKNEKSYVSFHIKGKTKMDAHRVSLAMELGKIPSQDAAHKEGICRDNKHRCVNPEHLDDASKSRNRRDENTAEKTIRDKNGRKKIFNKIIEKSSKSEKEFFYNILFDELYKAV